MQEPKKKYQFCKCIVVLMCIIFVLTLCYCLYLIQNSALDLTLGITAITVTGALFSSTIIWYMKKAQAENVIKLRMTYTEAAARIEYEVYEKKMRLKKELGMQDETEFEESVLDEMYTDAIHNDNAYFDSQFEEATSSQESEVHIG